MGLKRNLTALILGIAISLHPAVKAGSPISAVQAPSSQPVWLRSLTDEGGEKSSSGSTLWKPLLVTAAAGGTVYLLYSVRSR